MRRTYYNTERTVVQATCPGTTVLVNVGCSTVFLFNFDGFGSFHVAGKLYQRILAWHSRTETYGTAIDWLIRMTVKTETRQRQTETKSKNKVRCRLSFNFRSRLVQFNSTAICGKEDSITVSGFKAKI